MLNGEFVAGSNRITVDIVDRALTKVGPGPIMSCLGFDCDTVINNAGTFSARFPANDPRVGLVQLKRHFLQFYVDGDLVFFGLAEGESHEISDDGQRILVISGRDSLAELDETTLGFSRYSELETPSNNSPYWILRNYNDINGYWPINGSLVDPIRYWQSSMAGEDGYVSPSTDTLVYGSFAGETALRGLIRIAEHTGEAFRLTLTGTPPPEPALDSEARRHVTWIGTQQISSGVRAVQSAGDAVMAEENPFLCFIQRLTARRDASRMLTKIYPYGAGLGETRLDLNGTSRSAPAGFTLDEADNSITSDDAETYTGKTIGRHINFKDIRPLYNTDADVGYAKDYLFDAALAFLQRNDDVDDNVEYDLEVAALPSHVQVGETLRVVYQDDNYDLDSDFYLLGIRRSVDSNGASTYRLTVSSTNQWRLRDTSAIVAQMEEGEILLAHPQIDAVSYWENFREEVGDNQTDHMAEMPFILGDEIVTVRQVLFRYKVDRILVGVNTYAYASSETGLSDVMNTGDTVVDVESTTVDIDPATVTVNNASVTVNTTGSTTLNNYVGSSGGASDIYTQTNFGNIATATQIPTNWAPDPANHHHMIGGHVHEHSHTHTIDHGHTVASEHGHSTVDHGHATTPHDHTVQPHDHTTLPHNHSQTQHSHDMPALQSTFSLMRIPALQSYVMAELEYSVNGGAWASLDSGTPVAGGYYEIDITSEVQEPSGLRRPLQEDNIVQVRRKIAAGTGKSALVRAKLGVRVTVQSIILGS